MNIMRIFKWELKKLITTPAVYGFVVCCVLFNIIYILSNIYTAQYANETAREIAQSGQTRYSDVEDVFDDYETAPIADVFIDGYGLQGAAQSLMRGKYESLQAAVDRNAETGVGLDIYADHMTVTVHRSLFNGLLNVMLTESILFAVLTALYILGYEHQNKTEPVVYSTKTGRRVTRHKRLAALTATAGGFAVITALTLAVYFVVWDFSVYWGANVSSMMNLIVDEAGLRPVITWFSLTVAQYLAAMLALSLALTLVFSIAGSFVGLLTRNTYIGFIVIMLVCLVLFAPIMFYSRIGLSAVMVASTFTPVAAWYSQGRWLTDMGSLGFVPLHETVTIFGNLALFTLLAALAARRFLRKDIV